MGRIARFRKSAVFAAVVFFAACGADGGEPVDYVHLPEAIVIQLLEVDGRQPSFAEFGATVPQLTVYGDGTVIYQRDGEPLPTRASLPEEALLDLVRSIADEGFLTFVYEQPVPDGLGDDGATTYLYVNTKSGVNSVRAYGLAAGAPGDGAAQYEALRNIRERLLALDIAALGGEVAGPYESSGAALFVDPLPANSDRQGAPWPEDAIDLASIAADGMREGKRVLSADELRPLVNAAVIATPTVYTEDGVTYEVAWRPTLPHEDNFPEFDFPTR